MECPNIDIKNTYILLYVHGILTLGARMVQVNN